jgi:arylsulfatase A-like enzyme
MKLMKMQRQTLILSFLIVCLVSTFSCVKNREDSEKYPVVSISEPGVQNTPDFRGKARGHDIILFTIDTLRASHLHCYGYPLHTSPCIDSLAHDGLLFETVYTPIPYTLPSHASILSSLYPHDHGLFDNTLYTNPLADKTVLPSVLKKLGYETAAFVSAFVLHSKFGLSDCFDHYNDRDLASPEKQTSTKSKQMLRREASATIEAVIEWLKMNRNEDVPLFTWIHFFDVHPEFNYNHIYFSEFRTNPYYSRFRNKFSGISPQFVARYDAAIRTVDDEIKRLLTVWNRIASPDPLVIITSDHGESLGEHNWKGHGNVIYEQTLRVPLILYAPWLFEHFRGSVNTVCTTLDIFPTLMTLLDYTVPGLTGQSLFPVQEIVPGNVFARTPQRSIVLKRKSAVIENNWKLIIPDLLVDDPYRKVDINAPEISQEIQKAYTKNKQKMIGIIENDDMFERELSVQLFDLKADPLEERNLADEHPEIVRKLIPLIQETYKRSIYLSPVTLSEEDKEALKALGYFQ